MGHTADTHQTYTFAQMAVQTSESMPIPSHPKVATSSLGLALKPPCPNPPNPAGLTAFTKAQLLDAQTQLEAAYRDKHLTKMLQGVVAYNTHCLALLSLETGLAPYLGPAQYIHACYLRSQSNSTNPHQRLFRIPQKLAPWMCLPPCDVNRRVRSLTTRQVPRRTAFRAELRYCCCDIFVGSVVDLDPE